VKIPAIQELRGSGAKLDLEENTPKSGEKKGKKEETCRKRRVRKSVERAREGGERKRRASSPKKEHHMLKSTAKETGAFRIKDRDHPISSLEKETI